MSAPLQKSSVRTKIVATVGPACNSPDMLARLIQAGVDVFRLNMAHGTPVEHERVVRDIRRVSDEVGRTVAILIDLAGPKIRLGKLAQNAVTCELGDEFELVRGEHSAHARQLTCTYQQLVDDLATGEHVLLADGTISMRVLGRDENAVRLVVESAGELRSHQGINVPTTNLSVHALTSEDREHAKWASSIEADFVSLSFVQSAADVLALKNLLRSHHSHAFVIAKIEKREALTELDSIVQASDGIMVARGDLGVEIDVAETPIVQKSIIASCRRHCKPVIVATQMLDSMTHARRPTRAEVTDVANAILDGADACMLSGETAIGRHPVAVVEMMTRIMRSTEQMWFERKLPPSPSAEMAGVHPVTAAVVSGAAHIAQEAQAKLVVVATRSGATARVSAQRRSYIDTVGVSNSERTLRRMCLFWGIEPLKTVSIEDHAQMRAHVADWGRSRGWVEDGDRIVFITGSDLVPGAHNVVVVHEVDA